jgi:hypothetical protein
LGLKELFDAPRPVISPVPVIHDLCLGTFSLAIRADILIIFTEMLLRPTLGNGFEKIQEADSIGESEDVDPEDAEEGVDLVEARVLSLKVLRNDDDLNDFVAYQVHCVD